jgi:ElaB/YqjD/DUF883 family membrane-anchored ribosome-binding protein
MAFSNLEFVKNLRSSGLTIEQSEAISKGVSDLKEDMNHLTTKEDFKELKTDFKDLRIEMADQRHKILEKVNHSRVEMHDEFKNVRTEMHDEFKNIRTEMHNEFKNVRTEMHDEFKSVRAEMHQGFREQRMDMHELKNDMREMKKDLLIYFDRFQSDIQNRLISYSSAMFIICTGIVISVIVFQHR